jgi:hypothetical protein
MKAYKYEIVIIDSEDVGQDEITGVLKSARHLNPTILSEAVADIGEWTDDHPANKKATFKEYYRKVFA